MKAILVERAIMITLVIFLLVTNVLAIANNAFHEKLYSLLSHFPYQKLLSNSTLNKRKLIEAENRNLKKEKQQLISKRVEHQRLVRNYANKITSRISRNAIKNASSIMPQLLPGLGDALTISITALDVIDACNNIREINELQSIFEVEPIENHENEVCGLKIPDLD
jgi:biopolymer transport protein ExbB/TolQ